LDVVVVVDLCEVLLVKVASRARNSSIYYLLLYYYYFYYYCYSNHMAPISATGTGIIPQRLDDERLVALLENLRGIPNFTQNVADADVAQNPCQRIIEQLVPLLEPLQSWVFEEQVRVGGGGI
jgi:hypothetical protein